jgi:hypothetical protein
MSEGDNLPAYFKRRTQDSLLSLVSHCKIASLENWCSLCSVIPCGPRNIKTSFSIPLFHHFWAKYSHYSSLADDALREILSSRLIENFSRSVSLLCRLQLSFGFYTTMPPFHLPHSCLTYSYASLSYDACQRALVLLRTFLITDDWWLYF